MCVMLGFSSGASAAPKKIVFTDNQWDSALIHSEIAKFIVENGFDGYEVEYASGSSILLWQALLQGDIDLDIEEWTENMATYKDDVARGDIIPLGELVPDSAQGFYVPRYMIEGDPARGIKPMTPDLKSVADLAKYAHIFKDPEDPSKSRIYGGVPGWEIDNTMYKKYQHYKLDAAGYNYFRVGSEPILFTSLIAAYNLGDPWVGYMYEPSWIAGKLDLVILEDAPYDPRLYDEGACEIPRQALMTICSRNFPEKAPELLDFFKKYRTGLDRISEALAYLEDTRATHTETAIWFMKKYDNLLDDWLTPAQAKKVRDALAKR